jgi:hypothetical protein
VSGHGEGNTINGFKVLKRMFDGLPYGNRGSLPYGQGDAPYGGKLPHRASGGRINEPVPVVLAGGEYVLKPEEVAAIGDGDISVGHRVLDDYVKQYRDHVIKTLKGLPGPRRD